MDDAFAALSNVHILWAMRTGVALAALATVLAAGCSEEHAGSLPATSAPVSPVATTVTASATPAEPRAVAAVRTFYAVLEAASREPSAGAARVAALLTPGCACRRIVDFLREQAHQHHALIRPVQVERASVATDAGDTATVFLTLAEGAGSVLDAQGRTVEKLAPKTTALVIDLVVTDGRYLIAQISTRG